MCLSVPWPICTRLQVMSPKILQKRTILCRLHRYPSPDRVWHRVMILLKASRLPLLNRIWTMSKYGPFWLHHCIYRREKKEPTDHEFITPKEKTQCQVHITFVNSTPTTTARTELHSMITFHHVNTRGSRAGRLRIAHLCVLETIVIHVSCLVLCRIWHWQPAQVLCHLFHPLFQSFRRSHLCTQALWSSTLQHPAMCHGRVADQHKSHLSKVMSPNRLRIKPSTPKQSSLKTSSPEELSLTGILGQIRINYRKDLWETLRLKIWANLEKLVQRCPTSTNRCIPIMTQRRSLQTRILKMENCEKCWLHHCTCKFEKTVNPLEC